MAVQLTEEVVFEWLDSHKDSAKKYVQKWVLSHSATSKSLCMQHYSGNNIFQEAIAVPLKQSKLLKHCISSPNLPSHRKRKSNNELRSLNRQELFMELLADVVSPNFDVNHLSHKILANVLVLINGDRSSLFLVEGTEEQPVLVSRLFDVMEYTSVEDAIHDENEALKIPFGVGIIGYSAQHGVTINLENAYEDPRFNPHIDEATGYRTKSILCMPIKTSDGQVIGVAQVINKKGLRDVFSKQDEEDFQTYLHFCAIGLINSMLLDQSFSLSVRLQVLLRLTRDLFEDTTCLELVIKKVMLQSLELIPSERCAVLLLDQDNKEEITFSRSFQVDHPSMLTGSFSSIRSCHFDSVTDLDVARQVVATGEPTIVTHPTLGGSCRSNSFLLDKDTTSLLCLPFFDKDGQTIGCAKLVNKLSGLPFNRSDRDTFEVFATFCGLGLHNVLMYEKIAIAHARHKVAVEVLSYHASASSQETDKFMSVPVPEADHYNLLSYGFDDLILNDDQTVLASIRMFTDSGLVQKFKIDTKSLYRWVLTVRKNYRPVPYHNWRHAFNVAQTMFTIYMGGELATGLTDCEKLALLVACFCHDLDHRGTNNAFQAKSESPLAELYSTSIMEHHHLDHCIMILNSDGNRIFQGLSSKQYDEVIEIIGHAILSTDLALYLSKRNDFDNILFKHLFDWNNHIHRDLLRGMLMTACDVAAITKPWPIQMRVADMVANEFFEQGDVEREQLHSEPIAMMDRKKKHELPKMQIGFIDFVCLPLYEKLATFSNYLQPLLNGVLENKVNWQHLADNPNSDWGSPVLQDNNIGLPAVCQPIIINVRPLVGVEEESAKVNSEPPISATDVCPLERPNRKETIPLVEAWRSQPDLTGEEGSSLQHSTHTEVKVKRKCIIS